MFDLLAMLIRERRRVVPKEELLDTVWGNRFVSESALTSRVKAARRAIGDDGRSQRLIRTVARTRLPVRRAGATRRPSDRPLSVSPAPPHSRRSDSARRVMAPASPMRRSAQGPPLVKAANWLSHLDYDWESPVWRHWLTELSRRFRLVRYDERAAAYRIGTSHGSHSTTG